MSKDPLNKNNDNPATFPVARTGEFADRLVDSDDQLSNARIYAEAILDTVRDPLLVLDKELRVRSVTKGFYQKFKANEYETEGEYFYELKSCPWNSAELIRKLEHLVATKTPFSDLEITCNFPAFGEATVLISARNLERINDEQLIIVSVEDITSSKEEKNKLTESNRLLEERIKLAVEATGMGTWDYNPQAQIAVFDEQCKKIFGFDTNDEVNYESLKNRISASDVIAREKALENAFRGVNGGDYDIEYRINIPDETRWVKSRGKAFFDEAGKAYRLVGTVLDITRQKINEHLLKESEERFRLASDAATAMIWMSDTDKQCNYFNKSWLGYTGRTTDQEMGNGWTESVHPDDFEMCLDVYNKNFDARKEFYMEFRLKRHDGEYRWISDAGAPRFSPSGLFEGYVGICMDIHEQKMTTDELEKLIKERTQSLTSAVNDLETSNQNLEEFAYVASHDLQEPLRKIQTFASFLQQTVNDQIGDDTKLYLSKIKDASNRMGQLIEDILSYSRLKNTDATLVQTDLNETVKQVLADLDLKISEQKAILNVEPLPTINAIPMRMQQVFQNVISNALKFSRKNEAPQIHISSTILSKSEVQKYPTLNKDFNYAMIEVTDNGIGFDQEFAEKIFVIFQRLNGRSEYEGTGIGLAICRKIIINHHGIIFANSEKGKGSTFHIILPVA